MEKPAILRKQQAVIKLEVDQGRGQGKQERQWMEIEPQGRSERHLDKFHQQDKDRQKIDDGERQAHTGQESEELIIGRNDIGHILRELFFGFIRIFYLIIF